jgi:hypothetical protein
MFIVQEMGHYRDHSQEIYILKPEFVFIIGLQIINSLKPYYHGTFSIKFSEEDLSKITK